MTKLLTIDEVKEILKVSKPTVYNLIYSEGFPCIRVGRVIRIPEDAFIRWIQEQSKTSEPE